MTFDSYALDPDVLSALHELGYSQPTPIQEKTLPLILEGRDLIALAETGSGKTAACAIPLCSKISVASKKIQVLVVVPTRELALQYATEAQKIGKWKKIAAFALLGGEDMDMQRAKLKDGVQLLIATPGRLIDFIYRQAIDISQVDTLVLDEADQMLSLGFYEDLDFIMNCLVHEHQTLLFSATMPEGIAEIAKGHMKDPAEVMLIAEKRIPEHLSLEFLFCKSFQEKRDFLLKLLRKLPIKQCMIFANARHEVERLFYFLRPHLSSVEYLHGGLTQQMRTSIISKFSRGKIHYLIASDIAARGLDFSSVSHVINLHFPLDQDTLLHRAGRTARAGSSGTCITLIEKKEMEKLRKLMRLLGSEPKWLTL